MPGTVAVERKVYILAAELMGRLRAFQTKERIASEVETARRLLGYALDLHDLPSDILARLRKDFVDCKDIRIAAKNVLATHPRVTTIEFGVRCVKFTVDGSDAAITFEESHVAI